MKKWIEKVSHLGFGSATADLTTNSHESAILNEDLSDGQTDITEDVNSDINVPTGIHEAQGANGESSQQKIFSKNQDQKEKTK